MKKLRLELITAQHGVEQYRHIMKKYNINDGSILDRYYLFLSHIPVLHLRISNYKMI